MKLKIQKGKMVAMYKNDFDFVPEGEHDPNCCKHCQDLIMHFRQEFYNIYNAVYTSFPYNVIIRLTTDRDKFNEAYLKRVFLFGRKIFDDTYKRICEKTEGGPKLVQQAEQEAQEDFTDYYISSLYRPATDGIDSFLASVWEV